MAGKQYDWTVPYLEALRHIPVQAHACRAAGVSRRTVYDRRKEDPEFAQAVDEAMETGVDRAEAEAFRRAVDGWNEPVVYQGAVTPLMAPVLDDEGKQVIDTNTGQPRWATVLDEQGRPVPLTVNKRSDAMLALVLKGRRKSVYAERTELTGADGAPVAVDAVARAARVASLLAKAKARAEAASDDPNDYA